MQYHFKIHRERKGCWAECLELEGCHSQGDTLSELRKNLKEVLDLCLDEPEDSTIIFPLPKKVAQVRNIIAIDVDPSIALAFLIRRERLLKKWTQKATAERLGVPLYSYQKLESAKTANPEWKTLIKLLKIFPDLNLKLAA